MHWWLGLWMVFDGGNWVFGWFYDGSAHAQDQRDKNKNIFSLALARRHYTHTR